MDGGERKNLTGRGGKGEGGRTASGKDEPTDRQDLIIACGYAAMYYNHSKLALNHIVIISPLV